MAVVFFNVGWMNRYRGLDPQDQIRHGGAWVEEHGVGHEVYNFKPHPSRGGRVCCGWVQARDATIKIEKLGASREDEWVDGVTVVWVAKHPRGGVRVVGWYRNARVYRVPQLAPAGFDRPVRSKRDQAGFFARAKERDCRLLEPDDRYDRRLAIPRNLPGGMGQSPVWFASERLGRSVVARVEAFIKEDALPVSQRTPKKAPRRAIDVERKAAIERAAIGAVTRYYEGLRFRVRSVEKDNVGWDLNATRGTEKLHLEVKGLSAASVVAEVTPNEYAQMTAPRVRPSYRLCIVTNALVRGRKLRIFEARGKVWVDQFDAVLRLEERVAARVRL